MYNPIKLNNQSNLNLKKKNTEKTPINFPIFSTKILSQGARPGYPLATPSVLILTQSDEGNSRLTESG